MRMPFHLIILFAAALATHGVSAKIVAAEYFIDVDPGHGNGTRVELPSPEGSPSVGIEVSAPVLAGLSEGIHHLGVRFQDEEGDWSEAFARTFSKDAVPVPRSPVTIVAAEYFIDADPGQGLGTPVAIRATGDSVSLEIGVSPAEFASLSTGACRLAVRLMDNGGNWSEAFARTFGKDPLVAPLPERFLDRVEYQWYTGSGPVGEASSTPAPAGAAVHTWLPELPMPQGAEGDVFRLVITPYDTEGARGDSITRNVKLAPPPALAAVLAQAFPGAKPADLTPMGNPLGDTLNNLQKYYLGLDPTRRTGDHGLSVAAVDSSGGSGIAPRGPRTSAESPAPVALRYTRNRYARNVTGTVEASTTLAGDSWTPVEAAEEVTPLDPYTDRITLRPVTPAGGGGRQFFRLKISETP